MSAGQTITITGGHTLRIDDAFQRADGTWDVRGFLANGRRVRVFVTA